MPDTTKSKFEIIVELIKALVWPVIVFAVLIIFWEPLHLISKSLPSIVNRSETITIAGLSLKIRNSGTVQQPSPGVKDILSKLSPEAVERMLNNATSSFWKKGDESFGRTEYTELIKYNLYREIPQKELSDPARFKDKDYGFGVEITELGKETRKFLVQIIAGFVNELKNN